MSSFDTPLSHTKLSRPKPTSKHNLSTRLSSIFREHIDDDFDPSDESIPTNLQNHPFLPVPPPPPLKHDQKTLFHIQFKTNPKSIRHESSDEYKLRKARLELAAKLQRKAPKSPLLGRVDPKTGKVVSEKGFVGTERTTIQKNKFVRKKGVAAGDDIKEDWEGEGYG